MYEDVFQQIRSLYGAAEGQAVPLHEPVFAGREKEYVADCIDSSFVSTAGDYVPRFENMLCEETGAGHAIAMVNGTCALHIALLCCGVGRDDEVITQPLTFVATCNAIRHAGAAPVFIDNDEKSLGMSAGALERFLGEHAEVKKGKAYNKASGKRIGACLPVHVFGHACEIDTIVEICGRYQIPVVEDAAEAIGSAYKDKALGTFGHAGTLSFNGNKTITTGGGGAVLTNDDALAEKIRHIATTAKVPHAYEFIHDAVGYNYRMPNLNAALGCAQLERLPEFIDIKRRIAKRYEDIFAAYDDISFINEPQDGYSNYWLQAVLVHGEKARDEFLQASHAAGVLCRPAWRLMPDLPMYKDCQSGELKTARMLYERLVNLPSSVNAKL